MAFIQCVSRIRLMDDANAAEVKANRLLYRSMTFRNENLTM